MFKRVAVLFFLLVFVPLGVAQQQTATLPSSAGTAYVIRAGRLIDPGTGTSTANQMIAVKDGRIVAIGANVAAPPGAETIDLTQFSVLPGLVDAHNHLALTYKKLPENDVYYYTYVQNSTAIRAIQAASNGMQMLSSGFTVVRDLGNNGLYADTALRVAIEQGWIPGPTIINSGIIIGGVGGQFFPTPEMVKDVARQCVLMAIEKRAEQRDARRIAVWVVLQRIAEEANAQRGIAGCDSRLKTRGKEMGALDLCGSILFPERRRFSSAL